MNAWTLWTVSRRIAMPLLAAALTACAGTRPGHDAARAVEVGKSFKEDALWREAAATQETAVDPDGWWLAFGDPQLDALQDLLAQGNQSAQVLEARMVGARAALVGAEAGQRPTLSASLSGARSDNTSAQVRQPTNAFSASLGAGWELDLWGRAGSSVRAARANAAAAEADWMAA